MTTALTRYLTIPLLVLALSACTIHRLDIRQGNYVTHDQIEQLEEDMTREQVRFLLGTPILENSFRADRWDYHYFLDSRYRDDHEAHLVVWFEQDRVSRYETRREPTWPRRGDAIEAEVDMDLLEERDAAAEPEPRADTDERY